MLHDVYKSMMYWAGGLDKTQWFLLLGAAFVVGIFALRGFGSRSGY